MQILLAWLIVFSALQQKIPPKSFDGTESDCTCFVPDTPVDTLNVLNTLDSGAGSLRCAIECANESPNQSYIFFALPASENYVIYPLSTLPVLNKNLSILDTARLIRIDGSLLNSPGDYGFRIAGDSITIEGLQIVNFPNNAIDNYAGNKVLTIKNNYIENCGRLSESGDGMDFRFSSRCAILNNKVLNNHKDGIYLFEVENFSIHGNEISGNGRDGINIYAGKSIKIGSLCSDCSNWIHSNQKNGIYATQNASHLEIYRNFIGLSKEMAIALPNGDNGISLNRCDSSIIGSPNVPNYISGNILSGISMSDSCFMISIRNNNIGLSVFPGIGLPNGLFGIRVNNSRKIHIGSVDEIFGNHIGYNPYNVYIDGQSDLCSIDKNTFYCSSNGIFLEPGANQGILPPVDFDIVSSGLLQGSGGEQDLIQAYLKNTECLICQGNHFLGSDTILNGTWEILLPELLQEGDQVSLIRTDSLGNTSSFSLCKSFECELFEVEIIPLEHPYICENGQLTLTTNVGETFLWNTGETSPEIIISEGGQYVVDILDERGCPGSDSILVTTFASPELSIFPSDSTVFCGSSQVIQASGQGIFTWNTGATGQVLQVFESGNYCVRLTNPFGCFTEACVPVTKGDEAEATIDVLADMPYCDGDLITLKAAGGIEYDWNVDGASGAELVVGEQGNYAVTVTNEYGCIDSVSQEMNFYPSPQAKILPGGYLLLCYGDSILLTASGGLAYVWNSGDSVAQIFARHWGDYEVTVTNEYGCEDMASQAVSYKPRIVASILMNGPDTLCNNDTLWLSAQYTKLDSIRWNTGFSGDSILVTTGGLYSATFFNLGCHIEDSVDVFFHPLPPAIDTLLGPIWSTPDSITEHSVPAPDSDLEYRWTVEGGMILGQSPPGTIRIKWTDNDLGQICVSAVDGNGCVSGLYCQTIDLSSLKTNALPENNFLLYPNPGSDYIYFEWVGNQPAEQVYLNFYDLSGKLLRQQTMLLSDSDPVKKLDIRGLPAGVYWIRIAIPGEVPVYKKLIHNF